MIALKTDFGDVPAGIDHMLGEDLPFTIARFLTMQAQSGQRGVREAIPGIFHTRNDWTTKNIRITPATKQTQMAEVYTDTSNRKTGAEDYLPRQDEGGEKVPLAGHRYLAIPTKYLRAIAPGVIPDALRPRQLLPANANIGDEYEGSFNTKGAKPRRALGRGARKKLGNGEFAAFVQHAKNGTLCIFVRHGGMGYRGSGGSAEPWYTLVPHATVKARFPMEKLVQQALDDNGEKNFDRAAAEVLVNAALRSGMRVRF